MPPESLSNQHIRDELYAWVTAHTLAHSSDRELLITLTAHEQALRVSWELAHAAKHQDEFLALNKASASVDTRLEAMNELRAQITSERGNYVIREMLDSRVATLEAKLDALEATLLVQIIGDRKRIEELERNAANASGRHAATMIGISLIPIALSIYAVLSR